MIGKRVNRLSQGKTSCFAHRHSCAVGAQQGRKRARFLFLSRFVRDTNLDVTTFAQEIQNCIACRAPRSRRRRQIPPNCRDVIASQSCYSRVRLGRGGANSDIKAKILLR